MHTCNQAVHLTRTSKRAWTRKQEISLTCTFTFAFVLRARYLHSQPQLLRGPGEHYYVGPDGAVDLQPPPDTPAPLLHTIVLMAEEGGWVSE